MILQSFLNKIIEQKKDIYEIFELQSIKRIEIENYYAKLNINFTSATIYEYNQLEKMKQY